jgi:lipopolysaccharide transport system ATP-binding protein
MSKTVIKIENLSKIYRLGEVGTGTLSHDLNRFVRMNPRISSTKLSKKLSFSNAGQVILGQEDPYAKVGHVNHFYKNA